MLQRVDQHTMHIAIVTALEPLKFNVLTRERGPQFKETLSTSKIQTKS
jgi:hypothetical protein